MESPILTSSNLSIGYAKKKRQTIVASGISVSLDNGKLISLIGPNGAGKSTFLRTITGIQKPISGRVTLDGKDISSYSLAELSQKISLVLTEKLPPSDLTVAELAALGRQPYTNWIGKMTKADIAKVEEALSLAGISHLSSKKYYEISDGQLQNALIARALAQDTPLIVLDEPTTHLDLQHKAALFRLLKKLSLEMGKCILFSTHDIEMAIQLSDEIMLMNNGTLVQDKPSNLVANGSFDDLFADKSIVFDREKMQFLFTSFNSTPSI